MATAESLAAALLDKDESLGTRDDAAMDLSEYDDAVALQALIQIAQDPNEDEMLHSSAGESIGQIWHRKGEFNDALFDSFTRISRKEVAAAMGFKEKLAHRLR